MKAHTNTGTKRHDEIAAVIRGALSPIFAGDNAKADAAAALQDAADGAMNAREGVMATLASASEAGRWTEEEIDVAARLAIAKGNAETPKAVATFVSEAKRAMHPAVRARFGSIVNVRDGAWDAEAASPKDQPRPCKAAFSRRYHMLVALLGEGAKGRYHTSATVLELARSRDPATDPDKAIKRVKGAIEVLQAVHHDFRLTALQAAIDALQDLDAEDLRAARDSASVPVEEGLAPAPQSATIVADSDAALFEGTGVAAPVPLPATSPVTEPATGAVDILEDILTDFQAAA